MEILIHFLENFFSEIITFFVGRAVFPRKLDHESNEKVISKDTYIVNQTVTMPVKVRCKNCDNVVMNPDSHCPNCGKSLYEICPYCGKRKPLIEYYCSKCGKSPRELRIIEAHTEDLQAKTSVLVFFSILLVVISISVRNSIFWLDYVLRGVIVIASSFFLMESLLDLYWLLDSELYSHTQEWLKTAVDKLNSTIFLWVIALVLNIISILCGVLGILGK